MSSTQESVRLVREQESGSFGLYRPDENIIETYIGNDREELPGEYYGAHWQDAESEDLIESIEADIADVRADIEDLRKRELSEDQERELERMELRLESHEAVLEMAKEVQSE